MIWHFSPMSRALSERPSRMQAHEDTWEAGYYHCNSRVLFSTLDRVFVNGRRLRGPARHLPPRACSLTTLKLAISPGGGIVGVNLVSMPTSMRFLHPGAGYKHMGAQSKIWHPRPVLCDFVEPPREIQI